MVTAVMITLTLFRFKEYLFLESFRLFIEVKHQIIFVCFCLSYSHLLTVLALKTYLLFLFYSKPLCEGKKLNIHNAVLSDFDQLNVQSTTRIGF